MDLNKIKKQWIEYCNEFETTEYMDIEKHVSMAMKVGGLISEIEKQEKELQIVCGTFNRIDELLGKGRNELNKLD